MGGRALTSPTDSTPTRPLLLLSSRWTPTQREDSALATPTPRIKVYLLAPSRRPHYQLQWTGPTGRRVTRTTRTADPATAERMRADREYELNNGISPASGDGPPAPRVWRWAEVRAAYEAEALPSLVPEARKATRRALDLFAASAAPTLASDVDARAVGRFAAHVAGLGLEPATRQLYLSRVRTVLRWAHEAGMLPEPPRVKVPGVPQKAIRTVSAEQYRELLAACPSPCWRLFLCVLWHTGLRQSEAAALTWDGPARVDLAEGRVVLPADVQKEGGDTWLPLHPELRRELLKVPEGRRAGTLFPGVPRGGLKASGASMRWAAFAGIASAADIFAIVGASAVLRQCGFRSPPRYLAIRGVRSQLLRHIRKSDAKSQNPLDAMRQCRYKGHRTGTLGNAVTCQEVVKQWRSYS